MIATFIGGALDGQVRELENAPASLTLPTLIQGERWTTIYQREDLVGSDCVYRFKLERPAAIGDEPRNDPGA